MTKTVPVSRQIANRSKSNLALALSSLSKEQKRDMLTFYAFCRVIDDIADETDDSEHSKRASLNIWKQGVLHGFAEPDELQQELMDLCKRYPIKPEHLAEIIDGVAEDLTQTRYATYQELLSYCYKVASVVGLVSVEIFGYKNSICRDYAINLGFALQLTNIIRDVGEDARMQRIYLPQEDLRRFGVTEAEILDGKPTEAFEKLMELQYSRARHFYLKSATLLPVEDRSHMLAAEMMAQVYSEILEKIRHRHFRVFDKRIGLSRLRKITILGAFTARGLFKSMQPSEKSE